MFDTVARWAVLTFAAVHVAGLLYQQPVAWSASLTALALLCCTAGTRRVVAAAALTALIVSVDARCAGVGWPFMLAAPPAPVWRSALESLLLVVTAAALIPWPPRRPGPWALAGTLFAAGLLTALAAGPLYSDTWLSDRPLLAATPDRTGLLLATVPILLAIAAAVLTATRRGLPALTLALLAVPVAWDRADRTRFAPPPSSQGELSVTVYGFPEGAGIEYSSAYATSASLTLTEQPGSSASGWWDAPVDWSTTSCALLAATVLAALLALVVPGIERYRDADGL